MNTKSSPSFDKRDLRNALGSFGTGVTVVTSGTKQTRLVGVTANSFSSVSLEPPIVLWSLGSTSPSLDIFDASGRFVINILALHQVDLSKQFSSNLPDKFEVKNELAGLRPASPDGMPYIGALPKAPRVIAATGHGMLGLMMGPGTGKFVSDLVAGRPVSRDVLKFSPARPRL